jgi:stage V sporulation protein AD
VVGKREGQGPLANSFDIINEDTTFGEKTWEKAESAMQRQALNAALNKAGLAAKDIDFVFAGDLLNQCIGSTFALRGQDIPFLGLYGACSTCGRLRSRRADD